MKILITPDIKEWAIGNLTKSIIKHNPRFEFYNVAVHPRGVAQGFMEIRNIMGDKVKFDLWHPMYWNSAIQLRKMMIDLREIPSLLFHSNHNSLEEQDWKDFDMLHSSTDHGVNILKKKHGNVVKIPYGIDLDKYSFINDYAKDDKAVGYVGRVVPWKHLKEICDVAEDLDYKVVGCGYIDKPSYWETVSKDKLDFNGGMGRGQMMPENFEAEIYRKMSVFVMYSTDEKESGTLPLLEAMARGIPVLCTKQGMARDLIVDGENGIFFKDSYDDLKAKLKMLMEDEELREKLRLNAWNTVRGYHDQMMARKVAKAYYRLLWPKDRVISVIIPTFNRSEQLVKILASIENQSYDAKEIIVCDDGSDDNTELVVKEAKKQMRTPILYLKTGIKYEYGLAKSRNMGVIESLGEILLFLDDRYILEDPETLTKISKNTDERTWHWGTKIIRDKASLKSGLIENFSWIKRNDFIKGGMFCERLNMYGGLSQETRDRYRLQNYSFKSFKDIVVREIKRSPRHKKRDEVWKAKFLLHKMYGEN